MKKYIGPAYTVRWSNILIIMPGLGVLGTVVPVLLKTAGVPGQPMPAREIKGTIFFHRHNTHTPFLYIFE
jgi:hypothetical protein